MEASGLVRCSPPLAYVLRAPPEPLPVITGRVGDGVVTASALASFHESGNIACTADS